MSDVAIAAFPDRRSGTGLYAFVEGAPGLAAPDLQPFVTAAGAPPPEHLQLIDELPRRASGEPRNEILQLIAMNQLDQIEPLIRMTHEKAIVGRIVADRRNLRDRFSF